MDTRLTQGIAGSVQRILKTVPDGVVVVSAARYLNGFHDGDLTGSGSTTCMK